MACRTLDDMDTTGEEAIKERYARVAGILDERGRRAVAASEALTLGRGGIAAVARATGVARGVIEDGIKELTGVVEGAPAGRIRRAGGGRKKTADTDPTPRHVIGDTSVLFALARSSLNVINAARVLRPSR